MTRTREWRLAHVALVIAAITASPIASMRAQAPGTAPSEAVRASAPWSVTGADLVCVVTEQRSQKSDALPTRRLIVYPEKQGASQPLFSTETPDTPLGISPLGEYNARMLVAWVGGSAYHFQVLAYLDGKAREVLAKGSRAFPEIVRDQQGNELLLFTELRLEEGQWRREHGTTEVFAWTGHGYDRLGQVPWVKRLECTSKETCARVQ